LLSVICFFAVVPHLALERRDLAPTIVSVHGNVELVYVPAGEFRMGGRAPHEGRPAHQVYLDAFLIGKNDVTVAQYQSYCDATGAKYDWSARVPYFGWHNDYPMVCVSWEEARAFCKWAGGDLPTEAQWEKAARGTDGRVYPWGNMIRANYGIKTELQCLRLR